MEICCDWALVLSQVKKINDTPAAMKAACAVCCCITPILVTLILFYERRFKKHAV